VVCRSDGSIWFTDPPFGILGYYEGHMATPELPTNVYRVDPTNGSIAVVAGDVERPNGLAFSPNESKLYVVEASGAQRSIWAFDVVDGTRLSGKRRLVEAGPGTPDGLRVDVDGNLWVGWGMGEEGLDGVEVGGRYRNRLFMCGSTSLYSLYVNTQGC
jgi:gluconolactonase